MVYADPCKPGMRTSSHPPHPTAPQTLFHHDPIQRLQSAAPALGAQRIECALADFTSLARGKLLATDEWVAQAGCRLPNVLFGMTVTGGWPEHLFGTLMPKGYGDMQLVPDLATLRARPGRPDEATVLCEPSGPLVGPIAWAARLDASELSPRTLLKKVLAQYAELGLQATVAPELEMFLLRREGAAVALRQAAARCTQCRSEPATSIRWSALAQFEPFFDALYAGCETLGIPLSGHLHEAARVAVRGEFPPGPGPGTGRRGVPLQTAGARDRRTPGLSGQLRRQALCSTSPAPACTGISACNAPRADWPHVFATPDGQPSPELMRFIAGLQAHTPAAMALFAPYDMSFDRIALSDSSPTHADWGHDDRLAAFRIPATTSPAAVRVENRLPGGDASPYLAVAATLAIGLDGMQRSLGLRSAGTPPSLCRVRCPMPSTLWRAASPRAPSSVKRWSHCSWHSSAMNMRSAKP